jgi:hypothetical protein
MVGLTGFEPATPCSGGPTSTTLLSIAKGCSDLRKRRTGQLDKLLHHATKCARLTE